MELVTGRGIEDHISAADIASMLRGTYGDTDVVLPIDDEMALTVLSANTAQVGTGGCMLQGHYARIETAEQLVIESGAPGYNRNDLVVARYSLSDENIQAVYLAIVKGVAVAGTAQDPAITEGNIDDGDTLVEFPIWRIPISGVNVGTPERIMPTVDTLQGQIETLRDSVSNLIIRREYTVTTGNSDYLSYYYADVSNAVNKPIIGMYVIESTYNNPAFLQRTSNNDLRVNTKQPNITVTFAVSYLNV